MGLWPISPENRAYQLPVVRLYLCQRQPPGPNRPPFLGVIDVSRLSATIRRHQESARTRREVSRAIRMAGSESVRNELTAMAIQQNVTMR